MDPWLWPGERLHDLLLRSNGPSFSHSVSCPNKTIPIQSFLAEAGVVYKLIRLTDMKMGAREQVAGIR